MIPAFLLVLLVSTTASAQPIEAGIHITSAQWSEFDGSDWGIGGRFTLRPLRFIGFDADLVFYPQEFPENPEFSGRRLEALFGITAGPQLGALRPFVKASYGFLNSGSAPEPFPCIAIFPPPLSCVMAEGHTLPAFEIGGGVQVDVGDRSFIRADIGSRWLRYPGPSFSGRELHDEDFWGARSRISVGAGVKF